MGRVHAAATLCLALLLAPAAEGPFRSATSPQSGGSSKHQGLAFEHIWGRDAALRGYGSEASADSLTKLKEIGATWVSITPFGFQRTPHDTMIRWGGSRISETDQRLLAVTAQSHAQHIRVLLKPHIWLRPPSWVGMIEPRTEADWQSWFRAYRAFILHYAALAANAGIDALCIGNELRGTTHREDEWRVLIAEIRATYGGILTYGAHANEVWNIPFWDALDYLGVSAYFPLVDKPSPSRAELVAGWGPIRTRLERGCRGGGPGRCCSRSSVTGASTLRHSIHESSMTRRRSISNSKPTPMRRSSTRSGLNRGSPESTGGSGDRHSMTAVSTTTTTRRGGNRRNWSWRSTGVGGR